jgi:hypothetical protein
MRQRAADGRDIAHADVRERPQRLGDDARVLAHQVGILEHRERRGGAELELAVDGLDRAEVLDRREAHELRRPEYAGLHHQHQRGAARNRADGRIVGVEQRDSVFQRLGLS